MVKRDEKYSWHVGSCPPPIDPHSRIKHQIVKSYLERYIQVLMSNVLIEKLTLSVIDGFAGGGEYAAENGSDFYDGSPLIALKTVAEQQMALNVGRQKLRHVDAKYYFVEKDPENFAYLSHLVGARVDAGRIGRDIELLRGSFQQRVGSIIADIRKRAGGERAIFLLDQYSYDQVPAPLLKTIFSSVKGAEVLLTFNVDSLITFLSNTEKSRKKLEEMGLDRYIDWESLNRLKSTGGNVWRSAIQRNLAKGLVEVSGARHYTIFYITPMGSTSWTYWLVHLSNSFKARDVMMELHWQNANHFSHYLEPDLFTLGYRTDADRDATGQDEFDLGDGHHFDAIANRRCLDGLAAKLVPAIYDLGAPTQFGSVLEEIGSLTPGTADMIRLSLDAAIRNGDISAAAADGAKRTRGSTLKPADILTAGKQRPIFFL
ncbi:MAG: three-Cys-motif partner protein TcmP [Rubrivivax sp.]